MKSKLVLYTVRLQAKYVAYLVKRLPDTDYGSFPAWLREVIRDKYNQMISLEKDY